MSKFFTCRHCQGRCKKNPRIKEGQNYCGSRECQNARKRKWDQHQRLNNPCYKVRRQASNRKWRDKYPAHKYQKEYRESHPIYCDKNREKQISRNANRQKPVIPPKIVKTDTLTSESVATQELYVFFPYKKTDTKKIVKTDVLIVQIVSTLGIERIFSSNSS